MIPLLFDSLTTDFSGFGIGHLSDSIDPQVLEERNGEYTLTMQYPIDGEHFDSIGMRSIILAKPSPAQDPQPFRVFRITKPINSVVTIYARHIRYDLEGIPVAPFSASGIIDALRKIKSNALVSSPFSFSTNKTNTQTMTLETPASTLSLLGGVRGSMLDIYGGEYKYNIWNVSLLSARGANNGVVIRYGVDLTDFQQEENCNNCYTGVLCFWKSMDGDQIVSGTIQSAGTFDYVRIKTVDRSGNYEAAPTVAQLNQDAVNYINDNKVGVPKVSINLSFANLEQTSEYENIRQSVELCDQITVEFPKIGVTASAKIIRTNFAVLTEKYISVEIGDSRTSLADSFVAVQTKAESAPTTAEMQQAINVTTAAITGANGGSVRLLDTNDDKLPDTLYIADNPEPLLASKVWRFNYEGWGASENGYNGPFTMGATFAQGFLAEFITAGYLSADRIKANSIAVSKLTGTISNGEWEIDLDAGTLSIGKISADNITAGILDASQITVENLNADNITVGTLNAARIADNSLGGVKLQDLTITGGKIAESTIGGSNIKALTITGSNVANETLAGGKIVSRTLSDTQIAAQGVSTASLSSGVNTSLGYANFSNSAFFEDSPVEYINTRYLKVGSGATFTTVGASTLYVGGYLATWAQPAVSLSAQFAFKATDQGGNERWVNAYASTASLSNWVLTYGG